MSQPQLQLVQGGTERPVLDPTNPLATARAFLQARYVRPEGRLLHHHQSEFFRWRGTHYVIVSEEELLSELWAFLEHAERLNKDSERVPYKPSADQVKGIFAALRAAAQQSAPAPAWLDNRSALFGGPPASELRACRNGILHLATRTVQRPTPQYFNTAALPYPFEASAGPPIVWLRFLESLWPDEPGAIATLQEFFGYCLTDDTRYQKILLIVGPRRSGKGTIGDALRSMVGEANVVGPSLAGLASNFGMAPLIGKTLALISDARLSGRADKGVVLERLLNISGEDVVSVDRKYGGYWTGRMTTKLVILSNELPQIDDASAALASRFIPLQTQTSFLGREDHNLRDRIQRELPAILLWALDGLDRLTARGRFQPPASSTAALKQLEDLASPVAAFIQERCMIGPNESGIQKGMLYQAYKTWCGSQGIVAPRTAVVFARDLRAAYPAIRESRPLNGGVRMEIYTGISMK
jgi:putative DNA primase/helicase